MTDDGDEPEARDARISHIVLRAVAAMALRSKRAQADVDAALHKVGLVLAEPERRAIVADLASAGLVENVIPLSDGAVLLTVTPRGLIAGRG